MRRPIAGDDVGLSLLEVTVALAVLTVVMSVATAGIVQAYRSVGRAEAASVAQAQLHTALATLDREVRYARWVRTPAERPGHAYLEFLTTDTASRLSLCHRAVVNRAAGTLHLQTWRPDTDPSAGRALASGLVLTAPAFALVEPGVPTGTGPPVDHQLVRVRLTARAGGGTTAATVTSETTFTAVNTTRATTVGSGCIAGRPA